MTVEELQLPGLSDPQANELTKVRADGPDTSNSAKLGAYPRSGTRKWRALLAFARQSRHPYVARRIGLTDYELGETLRILRGSASKVRGLLSEGGWVEDSGHRRPTDTGSPAIVWVLTPPAVEWFAARTLEELRG